MATRGRIRKCDTLTMFKVYLPMRSSLVVLWLPIRFVLHCSLSLWCWTFILPL